MEAEEEPAVRVGSALHERPFLPTAKPAAHGEAPFTTLSLIFCIKLIHSQTSPNASGPVARSIILFKMNVAYQYFSAKFGEYMDGLSFY